MTAPPSDVAADTGATPADVDTGPVLTGTIDADVETITHLGNQAMSGNQEAKNALASLVKRSWSGDTSAQQAIAEHKRREVVRLNDAWERGELRSMQRDTGHGLETHSQWQSRQPTMRPCSTRHRRASGRRPVRSRRGSRRGTCSRAGPSSDDSDEPEPPLGRQQHQRGGAS